NPNLAIRIGTSQLDWELNIDSSDIGIIHTTRPERMNLHYRLLVKAEMFPVCSAAVAARIAGDTEAKALNKVPRLALYTAPEDWGTWLDAAGIADSGQAVTLKFDTYLAALQSALDGQGLAIAPGFLVADDLKAGRLVAPFALKVPQPSAWYMICRKERVNEARIRQFEKWLVEQFEAA
ncbi:LysR substrate-binding domain-containing protein, partial [Enterobacter hormaechei]|nr:LysR substrate-binding domain-containing protein [Enterobacter hormaechei]